MNDEIANKGNGRKKEQKQHGYVRRGNREMINGGISNNSEEGVEERERKMMINVHAKITKDQRENKEGEKERINGDHNIHNKKK